MKNTFIGKYELNVTFTNSNLVVRDRADNDEVNMRRNIVYTEVCNFINKRFPARMLTVALTGDELLKLISSRTSIDDRKLFDLELLITPMVDTDKNKTTKVTPFSGGAFKAEMIENESVVNRYTINSDNAEYNYSGVKDISFYLFRESELEFSLNDSINYLYENTTLTNMFYHMLQTSNPTLRYCMSNFGHNPVVPRLLIPNMDFNDVIELLDEEFGLYKTNYTYFIKDDIFYMLNTSNDISLTSKELDNSINVTIIHEVNSGANSEVTQDTETNEFEIYKSQYDIKFEVSNKDSFDNDYLYVNPNGTTQFEKTSNGRTLNTLRKITNVPVLIREKNLVKEYVSFDTNYATSKLNPLTKITLMDSINNLRTYRIHSYQLQLVSSEHVITKIRGFRNIYQETQQ